MGPSSILYTFYSTRNETCFLLHLTTHCTLSNSKNVRENLWSRSSSFLSPWWSYSSVNVSSN